MKRFLIALTASLASIGAAHAQTYSIQVTFQGEAYIADTGLNSDECFLAAAQLESVQAFPGIYFDASEAESVECSPEQESTK